jgi:toxin ParE1/3/4
MRTIDRRPRARRDLIEIWFYTLDKWDEPQADHYLRVLNQAIERLADNPGLGTDYGHVRPGLRRYAAGRHRIFYRVGVETIEIVRILHPSMDLAEHLSDNEN